MHFSGNGIMSRTTECLHYMHLWVQLVSGILLYIVLCALHIFVYPPPWIYGLSCPKHWLLTIVSQHSSSCSALSLLERMEDGSTADFNFLCFLTTIQLFMEPPCTSHSCFILEHLGCTSHRVILSRMWTVLWSCNSGLSNYGVISHIHFVFMTLGSDIGSDGIPWVHILSCTSVWQVDERCR